ncbi:ATP synthase subunit I [Coralloluteibacterium stylophorae]|uniref:ATP synthase subunit I n=1 Tax=Coralloluteibacterium stylophorae TaxID=1776034 RepID=A0A8J8B002_9GAMM|nr:ATP synthase subunit I [Coralloluteibacterium stylophorae]
MLLAQLVLGLGAAGVAALLLGPAHAQGVIVGAAVIATGFAVFGWRTDARSPVVPAGRQFGRLLLGTVLKWLVIVAGLVLAMSGDRFAAAPVLAGALVAYLAYFFCLPWLLR